MSSVISRRTVIAGGLATAAAGHDLLRNFLDSVAAVASS